MGSLCSKRYIVSNCEKDPEKQGENDVSYIQTTYTKYREDDPIYNDTRENSKEEQGYFSGSDVSSVLEETDTSGNGKNMGNENQNNELKEDLKIEDGRIETSMRERQNSYNNGGFIDEEDEMGIEYMNETEIDEIDDCNYREVTVSSKDVKESHNSYHNEGFISETNQADEVDDCLIKTKPKKDTGNLYHKGGLIDETDEMDDCIVHKEFVVFPDDLEEREEKTKLDIVPTQSTMYNANNVLVNNLEEKEEVDLIANNEKLYYENLEEKIEKVQPDDSITITQSTIFISGNDITNDHKKTEEMKEENTIPKVSQFHADYSENIKEISLTDNITSQSTIYKSGDLFLESSEEIDGKTQPDDINTHSFIYKAGDIFVNDLDEDIEGMTESEDFAMNQTENMSQFNDIVTLPTVYKGKADEINNLSKSTIYKSGGEITDYSGEINENISLQQGDIVLHSTIYKAGNAIVDDPAQMGEIPPLDNSLSKTNIYKAGGLFTESSEEIDGLIQPVDINIQSSMYKAGDIFENDLEEEIDGMTESEDFAMNDTENMNQFNDIVSLPTVYKGEADEINNFDNILSKSTIYKSGEQINDYSGETDQNTDIEDMDRDKIEEVNQFPNARCEGTENISLQEGDIVLHSTIYKAGHTIFDDPAQMEEMTPLDNSLSKVDIYKAGDLFDNDPNEMKEIMHSEDNSTLTKLQSTKSASEEDKIRLKSTVYKAGDIVMDDLTQAGKIPDHYNIVFQSTINKAGEMFTYDSIQSENMIHSQDLTTEKLEEICQLDDLVPNFTTYSNETEGTIDNENIVSQSTIYKAGNLFHDKLETAKDIDAKLDDFKQSVDIASEKIQENHQVRLEETNDVSNFEAIAENEEGEKITHNDIVMQSTVYKAGGICNDLEKETNELSQPNNIVVHSAIYKAGDACNDNFTEIRDMNLDEDIVEEKTPFNEIFTQSYVSRIDDSEEAEETTKFDNVLSQSTIYKAGENFTEEMEEISHSDDIITKTNIYKAGEISSDITQEEAQFDPLVTTYKNHEDFIEPDNILTNYRDPHFTYNTEELVENNQNDELTKSTLYDSEDFTDDYTENIDILSVNVEHMDEYKNGYSRMQENIDHNLQTKTSIYKAGEVSAKVDTPKEIPYTQILTQSMKFKGGEIYTDDLEETDNIWDNILHEESIIEKEEIFANKLFSICKEKNEENILEDNLLNDNVQSNPNKNESYKVSRQIWLMQ